MCKPNRITAEYDGSHRRAIVDGETGEVLDGFSLNFGPGGLWEESERGRRAAWGRVRDMFGGELPTWSTVVSDMEADHA